MKSKILVILIFVFCFLFSFDSVLAIGIGAKPSFLDLELKAGQSERTEILVYNISQEAGLFQVFPDELKDWIKIEPDNFRLEAGENKKVEITILAKEGGKKTTNLSVSAMPLDRRGFTISSGIKIPLHLNVEEKREFFLASVLTAFHQSRLWLIIEIFIGILAICLIELFVRKYFKRRKKVVAPPENLPVKIPLR